LINAKMLGYFVVGSVSPSGAPVHFGDIGELANEPTHVIRDMHHMAMAVDLVNAPVTV
jgi:hypothetical protein